MTLRARSCAAALVVAGLALYTESAHADAAAGARAAPMCTVGIASSPTTGVSLPANAPALLVVDQSYDTSAPTIAATLVDGTTRTELTTATDSHGLSTMPIPTASAKAGTYSVEITTSCPEMAEPRKTVTPLTLTAPAELPTSVGTLVHVPTDPPTGLDKVRLEPTPGMTAFLAAAQLELKVNGVSSSKSTFLSKTSAIEMIVDTGDVCIENGALHREKRVVKVTLEGAIAGVAESPAAASVDVPIDCGAIKWTSGLDLDKDGKPDTGSTNALMPTVPASSDDGGCSASPVGTNGNGTNLAALAFGGLGLVALRRRRR